MMGELRRISDYEAEAAALLRELGLDNVPLEEWSDEDWARVTRVIYERYPELPPLHALKLAIRNNALANALLIAEMRRQAQETEAPPKKRQRLELRCSKPLGRKKRCNRVCAVLEATESGPSLYSTENGYLEAWPWPDDYDPDGIVYVRCAKHGRFLVLPQRQSELADILEDPRGLQPLHSEGGFEEELPPAPIPPWLADPSPLLPPDDDGEEEEAY